MRGRSSAACGLGAAVTSLGPLWRLARACGIRPAYASNTGERLRASPEALLQTVRALGMDITAPEQAGEALRAVAAARAETAIEPVNVVWSGEPAAVPLRLNEQDADSVICLRFGREDGEEYEWTADLSEIQPARRLNLDGRPIIEKRCPLPFKVPHGYHRLHIELRGRWSGSHLFAAPARARTLQVPAAQQRRLRLRPPTTRPIWGAFLPLYALRSRRSWGVGDLTDLADLAQWIDEQGGRVVATLPLLAAFLDEPFEPSPYMPVSRLFWNELYLDVTAAPEFAACEQAKRLVESRAFQQRVAAAGKGDLVDYREAMAIKRSVLEPLAERFFSTDSPRRAALERALRGPGVAQRPRPREAPGGAPGGWPPGAGAGLSTQHSEPDLDTYARFRAATERRRSPWRGGEPTPADYDESSRRYHLYVQWLLREQLGAMAESPCAACRDLYLDLPVGVHPDGFDVWRYRDSFVSGVSVGAPPDDFFRGGQNWGLPPLHPQRSRGDGHAYFRACIANHLHFARILRIDHVMALHRLYWVPDGCEPTDGVYVRYPDEELYAVLCIESHRQEAAIVGENLGTVPNAVNRRMERHGIHPMYLGQFRFSAVDQSRAILRPVPRGAVASMNSHDTPTFAAFWEGLDIDQRVQIGLLTEDEATKERAVRGRLRERIRSLSQPAEHSPRRSRRPRRSAEQVQRDEEAIQTPSRSLRALRGECVPDAQVFAALEALTRELARSEAALLLLSLEDLWLERRPQNVPGTRDEANWRRPAAYSLEEIRQSATVADFLRELRRSACENRGGEGTRP